MHNLSDWFASGPGFLDTASYGIGPKPSVEAIKSALNDWQNGTADWYREWLPATDVARRLFADLVNTDEDLVATGPTTSVLVALVITSLPDHSKVLVPNIEFSSNLFPYLIHRHRGVTVRTTDLRDLCEAVDDSTSLVAVSAVQSATGELADLATLRKVTKEHNALLLVDATQGAGWLPLNLGDDADIVVASAYKWLLCPRGTAFMAVTPRVQEILTPIYANWFAGEVRPDSYYGESLHLASSARRFDASPAWFSWIGAVPSLELLRNTGIENIYRHDTMLASTLYESLGIEPPDRISAIVSLPVPTNLTAEQLPFKASIRDGKLRISFHLYNSLEDVDMVVKTLKPHLKI